MVLCFDVTNQKSFDNVRMWFEQIESHADAGIAKILVGNKVDLADERKITTEQAKQMAESQGILDFLCIVFFFSILCFIQRRWRLTNLRRLRKSTF